MAWTPAEVSIFPQLAKLDPEFIASAPDRVQGGALQMIQLAHEFQKQREDKETMNQRIAATNAQNLGITQVAPLQTRNTIEQLNSSLPNIGLGEKAHGAELQTNLDKFNRLIASKNALDQISTAKTTTEAIGALGDLSLAVGNNDLKAAQQKAALLDSKYQSEVAPLAHTQIMQKLIDGIASAETDKDRQDRLTEAEIALKEAQADQAKGMESYYAGGGARRHEDSIQELQRIQGLVNTGLGRVSQLLNIKVDNPDKDIGGKIPLSDYWQIVHGGAKEGEVNKTGGFLGFGEKDMIKNPEAEKILNEINTIYKTNDRYGMLADKVSKEVEQKQDAKAALSQYISNQAPTSFSNASDAQKAFDSGLLKVGTKVIVGGKPGTWR